MANRTLLALALSSALLGGCYTLAPDYERPGAPVQASWPASAGTPVSGSAAAGIGWRQFFADPRLQQVIALTLENNRDLRVAALNIDKARAQYQIQQADLLPGVDATVSGSHQRLPADLSSSGEARINRQYSAGIGFTAWELDLFGRIRSLNEQALQSFLATEETRRATQLSLVAEVANAWLSLAADRERLQLARETLLSQQASYGLNQRRFEAGVGSELELVQLRSTLERARADVARYTAQVAADENTLVLLAGSPLPADALPDGLVDKVSELPPLPAGLPAEVLLQRPDVLAAEHRLQAANANIGAARAAFFPSITLTASGGSASSELDNLFKGGQRSWSFVPRLELPIFDAGRNSANLGVSEANRDIARAEYEKAIQSAFRETASSLATRASVDEELAARRALVDATRRAHRLSDARFQQGVDSYLAVLDAQRSQYAAQQELVSTRLTALQNQVTLYKALGGGWQEGSSRL